MIKSDFHLLMANLYFAAALSGRVSAMCVGLFFAVVSFYYAFKGD